MFRDEQLSEIEGRFKDLEQRCAKLEKKYEPSPISMKIAALGWDDIIGVLFTLAVIAAVGSVGTMFYMYVTADRVPDSCSYVHENGGWSVLGLIDWKEDKKYGTFSSLEEAKTAAVANGCPETK